MTAPTPAQLRAAQAAAWAVSQIGAQDWDNLCQRFAEEAYGTQGQYPTAAAGGNALITHANRPTGNPLDGAQPGDLLFFRADASNGQAGHAGIYLGNGKMVSATPGGVKETGVLDDPYYGPRFAGWGPAPDAWQGRASTPELQKGAQQLIDAAQGTTQGTTGAPGGNGGKETTMPREQTPLEQEYQRQAQEAQGRIDDLQGQYDQAKALTDAYQRDRNVPNAQWLPAHGVTLDDVLNAQTTVADFDLKKGDLYKQLAKERAGLRQVQTRLAAEKERADTAAAKAPTVPSAGSQYLNTDASDKYIIARNPDGTIKLKADGSGPETIPNPNYRPPTAAQQAEQPRFFQRADGSVIVTDADGSNGRVLLGPDKAGRVPGTMTDPVTGDVYLQGDDGRPGERIFSGKAQVQTVSNAGVVTGINPQTGAQAWQLDTRTAAQRAKDDLDQAQAQYDALRPTYVKGLLDQVQAGTLSQQDAAAQLQQFDALHQSRAEALQQQQMQRLQEAAAETARHNQQLEQQAQADRREQARQANMGIAQRAAEMATTAETAHQKEFLPAAAAAGLQPLYDSFATGKAPAGMSPTILPRRESPQDVGQRVFQAVMDRLANVSPLVQAHSTYVPAAGDGQTTAGPPAPPPAPSTTAAGAPPAYWWGNSASNASAGSVPSAPPAALGVPALPNGAPDWSATTLPAAQAGQPINPFRYPAAYG